MGFTETSVVYAWLRRLRIAATHASVTALGRRTTEAAVIAFRTSAVGRLAKTYSRWLQASWSYRWLVSGEDPETVSIDFRATKLVAPLLAVFGWLLERFPTYPATVLTRRLRERPLRLLGLTLAVTLAVNLGLEANERGLALPVLAVHLVGLALCLLAIRSTYTWDSLQQSPLLDSNERE